MTRSKEKNCQGDTSSTWKEDTTMREAQQQSGPDARELKPWMPNADRSEESIQQERESDSGGRSSSRQPDEEGPNNTNHASTRTERSFLPNDKDKIKVKEKMGSSAGHIGDLNKGERSEIPPSTEKARNPDIEITGYAELVPSKESKNTSHEESNAIATPRSLGQHAPSSPSSTECPRHVESAKAENSNMSQHHGHISEMPAGEYPRTAPAWTQDQQHKEINGQSNGQALSYTSSSSQRVHKHSSQLTKADSPTFDFQSHSQSSENVGLQPQTDNRVVHHESAKRVTKPRKTHSSAENPGPDIQAILEQQIVYAHQGGDFAHFQESSAERAWPQKRPQQDANDRPRKRKLQATTSSSDPTKVHRHSQKMAPVPGGVKPINTLGTQPNGGSRKIFDLGGNTYNAAANNGYPNKKQKKEHPSPVILDSQESDIVEVEEFRGPITQFAVPDSITRSAEEQDYLPSSSLLGLASQNWERRKLGFETSNSKARRYRKSGGYIQNSQSSSRHSEQGFNGGRNFEDMDLEEDPIQDDGCQNQAKNLRGVRSKDAHPQRNAMHRTPPREKSTSGPVVEVESSPEKRRHLEKSLEATNERRDAQAKARPRATGTSSAYFEETRNGQKRNRSTTGNAFVTKSVGKNADPEMIDVDDLPDELAGDAPPRKLIKGERGYEKPSQPNLLMQRFGKQTADSSRPDLPTRGDINRTEFRSSGTGKEFHPEVFRLSAYFSDRRYWLHPDKNLKWTLLLEVSSGVFIPRDETDSVRFAYEIDSHKVKKIRHQECQLVIIFLGKTSQDISKIHLRFYTQTEARSVARIIAKRNKTVDIAWDDEAVAKIFTKARTLADQSEAQACKTSAKAAVAGCNSSAGSDVQFLQAKRDKKDAQIANQRGKGRALDVEWRAPSDLDKATSNMKKPRLSSLMQSAADEARKPRTRSRDTAVEPDQFYGPLEPRKSTRRCVQESSAKPRSPSPEPTWTELNPSWKDNWQDSISYSWQSGGKKGHTPVDRDDIERLNEGAFLNDNLVEFYLRYLQAQAEDKNLSIANRVYIHNSFFYPKLASKPFTHEGKISYSNVERWTTKVNLASYDYIIVPVNENLHWYLAIIYNAPKLLKPKPEEADLNFTDELKEEEPKIQDDSVAENVLAQTPEVTKPMSQMSLDDAAPNSEMQDTMGEDMKMSEQTEEVSRQADGLPVESNEAELRDPSPARVTSDLVDPSPKTAASKKGRRKSQPPARHIDPDAFRIITLDSLGMKHTPTSTNLKLYMGVEIKAKLGIEAAFPKVVGANATNIPQQENHCDCGVFLLDYVQQFLKDPDAFMQHVVNPKSEMEIKWQHPSLIRDQIRTLLFQLQAEQNGLQEFKRSAKKGERTVKGAGASSSPIKYGTPNEERGLLSAATPASKDASAKLAMRTSVAKSNAIGGDDQRSLDANEPQSSTTAHPPDARKQPAGEAAAGAPSRGRKKFKFGGSTASIIDAVSGKTPLQTVDQTQNGDSITTALELPDSPPRTNLRPQSKIQEGDESKAPKVSAKTGVTNNHHHSSPPSDQNQSSCQVVSSPSKFLSPSPQDTPSRSRGRKHDSESPSSRTTRSRRDMKSPDNHSPSLASQAFHKATSPEVIVQPAEPSSQSHTRRGSSTSVDDEQVQEQLLTEAAQQPKSAIVADKMLDDRKAEEQIVDKVLEQYGPTQSDVMKQQRIDDKEMLFQPESESAPQFIDNAFLVSPASSPPANPPPPPRRVHGGSKVKPAYTAPESIEAPAQHMRARHEPLDAADSAYLPRKTHKSLPQPALQNGMGGDGPADYVAVPQARRKRKQKHETPKPNGERKLVVIDLDD